MGTFILLAIVLLICVSKSISYLRKDQRGVILRLGQILQDWSNPLGPGLKWVWWPVETLVRWQIFTGQEDLVGAEGEALDDIGPTREGLIQARGKLWRAVATQEIPHRQLVRVVGGTSLNVLVDLGSSPRTKAELLDLGIAEVGKLLRDHPHNTTGHLHLKSLRAYLTILLILIGIALVITEFWVIATHGGGTNIVGGIGGWMIIIGVVRLLRKWHMARGSRS